MEIKAASPRRRRGLECSNRVSIQALGITKTFGNFTALSEVTLEIPSGELVAQLGPSGSGKTTLLRIIAGLEFADSGSVRFNGRDITERTAHERQVGFVFQHYALFRHMSVFENIVFGLRVRPRSVRPSEGNLRHKVHELLKLIQLENLAQRYPSQLSGGQRQRVALARALAVEPRVLLLDEPFGSLDAKVRQELRRWLRQLHGEIHITSVFVTHDQEEALEVADRVVVMNHGRIEQEGSPDEVYNHPTTRFVYNFLGNVNWFHGRIDNGKAYIHEGKTGHVVYVRPHRPRAQWWGSLQGEDQAHQFSRTAGQSGTGYRLGRSRPRRNLSGTISKSWVSKNEAVFVIPKDVKVFQVPADPSGAR